jgi:hypothetical protein
MRERFLGSTIMMAIAGAATVISVPIPAGEKFLVRILGRALQRRLRLRQVPPRHQERLGANQTCRAFGPGNN